MLTRLSLLAFLCLVPTLALAQDGDLPTYQPMLRQARTSPVFRTATTNCPGATCDTVWVGHSASGAGGSYLGVGVGGVWDFDHDIAGTDSTQGWAHYAMVYTFGPTRPANQRLEWAYDYGNQINAGNTALWAARDLAGRKYVKTGIAGAWHADDLAGVKLNVLNGSEPSAVPIVGARSAWCGLRVTGDTHAIDALTGNAINSDRYVGSGLASSLGEWPGFCNLWDQILYKDFPSTGAGSVAFRVRTDMSNFIDTSSGGSGWFNPDPTNPLNFVNNTADSFMVYVGAPNENAYDTNRRWFSEVLDLSKPWKELFAVSGKTPVSGTDTSVTKAYSGVVPTSGVVRVVFRIKTNRVRGDNSTGVASGFNSKDGAAVLDAVSVDGGAAYGFEATGDIVARALIPNLAAVGGPWATTGKPPASYFHVRNVAELTYSDLCGAIGSPNRLCNLNGNVLLASDKDNGERHAYEHNEVAESPTIDLAVRSAAPGTKNAQGIEATTAARSSAVIQFDLYPGFPSLDTGVFYSLGARSFAPTVWKQPVSGLPTWANFYSYPFLLASIAPICTADAWSLTNLGFPAGQADSVKMMLQADTQTWRFGGNLAESGPYFDNVRFGLVRTVVPPVDVAYFDRLQDQFPWNESVVPGDAVAFDTTAALMRTARRISSTFESLVAGDSLLATSAFGAGDGVSTGTRLDLVFRILPGPGSYTVAGNKTSPLVNRDPAHPFYATYLAANGPFGTPGGHGGTWDPNVWNSARMDSAELNVALVGSVPETVPPANTWMGTLHELDPNFATLGIVHPRCFLTNPPQGFLDSPKVCDGTVPALYGGVPGTTREGTKILPDGWFTPGTHVEYFVRKSSLEAPLTAALLPDTSRVTQQGTSANASYDLERWWNADVLPDFWKSSRYGGGGLACLLLVDQGDRRGADPAYRGALDTLGYGKNNGATSGWLGRGPNTDPNDPAGFVAANRGQYGLNFDHYDVSGAEGGMAGAIGARLTDTPAVPPQRSDRSGPSPAMLAAFYVSVAHYSGDLQFQTLSNGGANSTEPADDIALYAGFLGGASAASHRGLWLSGDDIANEAISFGGDFAVFVADTMGVFLDDDSYKYLTGEVATPIAFRPLAAWNHPGRVYGITNDCVGDPDALQLSGASGSIDAAEYGTGSHVASIARPVAPGTREYRTLFDGFDLSHLRSNYASTGAVGSILENDVGRLAWMDDVVSQFFIVCARRGPVIGVGDLPGTSGRAFVDALHGAWPNPAPRGEAIALRFALATARPVALRIYDVAGRTVATLVRQGIAGENVVQWDGRRADGAAAAPGIYFYALDGAPGAGRLTSRLVLVGNAR